MFKVQKGSQQSLPLGQGWPPRWRRVSYRRRETPAGLMLSLLIARRALLTHQPHPLFPNLHPHDACVICSGTAVKYDEGALGHDGKINRAI